MGSANTTGYKHGQVILLCNNGASYAKIEAKTGVKTCTAQRLYEYHLELQTETYTHSPGRPKLHLPSKRSRILTEVNTNCHTTFDTLARHHDCSPLTIWRLLTADGLLSPGQILPPDILGKTGT